MDTDYVATFNRPGVDLVDVREHPIDRFAPDGIVAGGQLREVDVVVPATGYQAMTGALDRIEVWGTGGFPLGTGWATRPSTYLGVATAGFPNLFMITGPGSPSVMSNMVVSIEQHVEWIGGLVGHTRGSGIEAMEVEPGAESACTDHVDEVAGNTLYRQVDSWYVHRGTGGTTTFMPYPGGVGLPCDLRRRRTRQLSRLSGRPRSQRTRVDMSTNDEPTLHPTSGYRHVTVVEPSRMVFFAGQMPMDETGEQVVGVGDLDAQVDRTVETTKRALQVAGARPEDVVRSVVYVVSDDYEDLAGAWHRFFDSEIGGALTSASTLLGVSTLGFPDQLVEFELTAALP